MMISTLEDPKAPRFARTAPDLLGPLTLLALAGLMATLIVWPAVYAACIAVGGARFWWRTRHLPPARRGGFARLSRLLGALALACSLAAMGCWEYYGLDHPLTHAGNGLAALSLLLLGLNERYNPQPWLPTALRAERRFLARCWALAFTTAGAGATLLILPSYLHSRVMMVPWAGATPPGMWVLPVLLALALSAGLSRRRRIAVAGPTYGGPLCSVAGTGMLLASVDSPALGMVLLPSLALIGVGLGLMLTTPVQGIAGRHDAATAWLMAAVPAVSAAVAAGLMMIVLGQNGGSAGYLHVFTLLVLLAVCGAVATLMAQAS